VYIYIKINYIQLRHIKISEITLYFVFFKYIITINKNNNNLINLMKEKMKSGDKSQLSQVNQQKDNKVNNNQSIDNGNLMGATSQLSGLNASNNFMPLLNANPLNSLNLLNTSQIPDLTPLLPTNDLLNNPININSSNPLFLNNNILNNSILSSNTNLLTSLAGASTSNKLNNPMLLNKINSNIKLNSQSIENSPIIGTNSNNLFPFTSYPLYTTNDINSLSSITSPIIPNLNKEIKLTSPSSLTSTPSSSRPATPVASVKPITIKPIATTSNHSTKSVYSYKPSTTKPQNKKSHIETTYAPTISKNKKRNYSDEKINSHSTTIHRIGKYSK